MTGKHPDERQLLFANKLKKLLTIMVIIHYGFVPHKIKV